MLASIVLAEYLYPYVYQFMYGIYVKNFGLGFLSSSLAILFYWRKVYILIFKILVFKIIKDVDKCLLMPIGGSCLSSPTIIKCSTAAEFIKLNKRLNMSSSTMEASSIIIIFT